MVVEQARILTQSKINGLTGSLVGAPVDDGVKYVLTHDKSGRP